MDNTIIGAIVSAIAILIGVVIGGFLTYKATKSIERKKLFSEKYEVIYDSSVQIRRWLDNENTRWWIRIMPGEHFDAVKEGIPCPTEKLTMMVDLYAPSLEKEVSKIIKNVDELMSREYAYIDYGDAVFEGHAEDELKQDSRKANAAQDDLVKAIKKLTKTNFL